MALSVVILAAGNGKRMNSHTPKVLHLIGGKPLLEHVIETAQSLRPDSIYIVYGNNGNPVKKTLQHYPVKWVEQSDPRGTGHALLQALPFIDPHHQILVLYGDVPLIKADTLNQLLMKTDDKHLGLLVATPLDPTGFGRILRNSKDEVIGIVEHKDATEEQLKIQEINTGILTGPAIYFKEWLPLLKNNNVQNEYYLTDIISMAVNQKVKIIDFKASCVKEVSGVNNPKELITLERYYQTQKAMELLAQGVLVMDPLRFDCRGELKVSKDVRIDINVIFQERVSIGEGSYVGPNNFLKNVQIGKNVIIHPNCVIEEATIGDNCIIGPFARIRPKTSLSEGVHVGNFVEVKNTTMDAYSKANHLTYLGDAKIGQKVNVGAGTITCNYDGEHKNTTVIEDESFIGSGTQLVAPVTIGKKAYIGAGSTITRDAPDAALTLSRAKQMTIKNWKKKKKDKEKL